MSINDINNAAAAMNQLKARYEGFLDDADDQIAARQAAYDAKAADLQGVVYNRMNVAITFDPDAAQSNLTNNGVFRDWAEFLTYLNALPSHSLVTVKMVANAVLELTTPYRADVYGPVHLFFKAIVNEAAGSRPVLKTMCYDKVGSNQWFRVFEGSACSLRMQYVDIEFDQNINEAINASTNNVLIYSHDTPIYLNSTRVSGGSSNHLCRTLGGISRVELSMNACELDGIYSAVEQYAGSGVAIIHERATTLTNGSVLHSPSFTLGTNLLKG